MTLKSQVVYSALLIALIGLLSVGVAAQRPLTAGSTGSKGQAQARAAEVRKNGVTEEQRASLRERAALIARIVNKHEAEAKALGMPEDWRRPFYESLMRLPVSSLQAVEPADTLQALSVAAAAEAAEPEAIGSSTEDLVYTPISPCRFIDTRYMAAGRINGDRGFDLNADGSLYGAAAACDPTLLFGVSENDFGGLAMNVTIVNPVSAPGWLGVKPNLAAANVSWLNWYQAGATVQTANMGIATVDQTTAGYEFYIHTSSATHVIVDIVGAFLAATATPLTNYIAQESVTCVTGSGSCSVTATCPAGYRLTGGGLGAQMAFVTGWYPIWNGPYVTATPHQNYDTWLCQGKNTSGNDFPLWCYAVCSQTPGR